MIVYVVVFSTGKEVAVFDKLSKANKYIKDNSIVPSSIYVTKVE